MSTRTSDLRTALLASLALAIAFDAMPAAARKPKVVESFAATPPAPLGPPAVATGAIFQVNDGYAGLYEGVRAHHKGDPVTIVLVEKTAASKSAGSKLDSSGGFGLVPPTTGVLSKLIKSTDVSATGTRNFTGTGTADQANSLSGEVSVVVAEVYSNGTMLVQGQKRVTLNRGDEFLKIKGIVRIADIGDDNRILSTRVADAQISYTGKGDVARASRQGWLSRFFSVVSPF